MAETLTTTSSPFPDQIIRNLLLILMNFEIQNGTFIVKFSVRSISVGIAVMKCNQSDLHSREVSVQSVQRLE